MKRTFSILTFLIFAVCCFTVTGYGQMPTSSVYLVKMSAKDGKITFGTPFKITDKKGYNNQPFFLSGGASLFYASEVNKQIDIFRYDIETKKTTRLTNSPDSEFSPTPMPGGTHFSVIRLITTEGPRKGAQPLMAFPINGGEPKIIFEKDKKVGYHAWLDKKRLAMFILGEPHTLQLANLETGDLKVAAKNIGAALLKVPGKDKAVFVQQGASKEEPGVITELDAGTMALKPLIKLKPGYDYFTITPTGTLIMPVDGVLYFYAPGKDKEWRKVVDFSDQKIKKISRLAVNETVTWLAFVVMD